MSKTWFITGASSGLGRLMTERLLERGDRVVATVRRDSVLDGLQRIDGDHLAVLKLDLTEMSSIGAAMDKAFAKMGRIDVVVSNAGYGLFGAAEEVNDAQIAHQIAANLTGPIRLIRAALPHLRGQGGGRILQVSSEGGQIAYPIDFIIAEPGPTATDFGAGLVHGKPMEVYADTPAGAVRRALRERTFEVKGDAGRTVEAMMAAADSETPPFRLTLGSTAYKSISKALANRLHALEAQRDAAFSADAD